MLYAPLYYGGQPSEVPSGGDISNPVVNNVLNTIVIGDDYLTANGRALIWTFRTSMTVATCFLAFYKDPVNKLLIEGAPAVNPVNPELTNLVFQMARTLTEPVSPGVPLIPGMYEYNVEMRNSAGNEITPIHAESFSRGVKRAAFVRKRT
jgi:hypothetical protein